MKVVIERCLGTHGVSQQNFEAAVSSALAGVKRIKTWYDEGTLPLLRLPERRDDLGVLQDFAELWRRQKSDIVVLGTGGSNLGAKALYALADQGFGRTDGGPAMHFMDNVDPTTFDALMSRLRPATTAVLAVSKSGTTAETLAQTIVLGDWLAAAVGEGALRHHMAIVTEAKSSPLADFAENHGLTCFDHDPLVGGRFSVFSNVGLLPALMAGLDAEAIRLGAWDQLGPLLTGDRLTSHPAVVGAAIASAMETTARKTTAVLMPYVDQLEVFGLWYRQLWAESLGKDGKGTTPVRAMGTVDQHSQLQLYLDGPDDKWFTIIRKNSLAQGAKIQSDDQRLSYLVGRTLGDLLDAEAQATAGTLIGKGRAVREILIERLDERVLGQLLMHFMLETVLTAHILGIDAFDQPAVEDIKILTRKKMAETAF